MKKNRKNRNHGLFHQIHNKHSIRLTSRWNLAERKIVFKTAGPCKLSIQSARTHQELVDGRRGTTRDGCNGRRRVVGRQIWLQAVELGAMVVVSRSTAAAADSCRG
jgi:hypothetical protein